MNSSLSLVSWLPANHNQQRSEHQRVSGKHKRLICISPDNLIFLVWRWHSCCCTFVLFVSFLFLTKHFFSWQHHLTGRTVSLVSLFLTCCIKKKKRFDKQNARAALTHIRIPSFLANAPNLVLCEEGYSSNHIKANVSTSSNTCIAAKKEKGPLSTATWLQGPEIEQRLPGLSIHIFILHNNTPAKATALPRNSHIQRQTESATPTLNNKTMPRVQQVAQKSRCQIGDITKKIPATTITI